MNDDDLDLAYSALCGALAEAGEQRAPLLLSMVCLALISRMDDAQQVLPLISDALARCMDGAPATTDTDQ